ncbi:hypothetical protein Fot_41567 [Forsythia ovata]|uniref:Uncharacterized protein n=1 Tax=Forsythia ovata TaxID=205694 RepID=A0ABD1RIN8_9LAMI
MLVDKILFTAKINFTKPKKNHTPTSTPKVVQTKISLKAKSPLPVKGVVIKEPSPNSDQNFPCEGLLATVEKYVAEVEEYKKKVNDYCSITEHLEVEVDRRMKELEDLRKNPEAERLKANILRLVNDLAVTHAGAQEKEDKLQKEIEKKKEKINSFNVQQMSWEEGLAKKNEELGVLNAKVESQDLALADMSAKVKTLQEDLGNFRDSDEGKHIFEDGKQAGGTELLDLIKDELPDINFDFLYEEDKTVLLALPLETN